MRIVYITSLLLWWLCFLFGKSQAQVVQYFSTGHTNGDIELSPLGHVWGVVEFEDTDESGFEQVNLQGEVVQYQTFAGRKFRYVAVNSQRVYLSDPEANMIYIYTHSGQCLDSIAEVDNPGNLFADEEGNVFTLETDLKKLVKISPDGVKTVLVADNFLNKNYTITGDEAGNLFTANRYTGQIFRWEKASGQLYPFAQLPTGSLCADGSQVSEIVYAHGQLYAASIGLSAIYRIDEMGNVSLLAGTPGISQELNDVANKARFVKPMGLAASLTGDTLFVSDNGHIRKIVGISHAGIEEMATKEPQALLYPNPATNQVNIRVADMPTGKMTWRLIDQNGRTAETGQAALAGGEANILFQSSPCGTYYMECINPVTGRRIVLPVLLCAQGETY